MKSLTFHKHADGTRAIEFDYEPVFLRRFKEIVPAGQRTWDREDRRWFVISSDFDSAILDMACILFHQVFVTTVENGQEVGRARYN